VTDDSQDNYATVGLRYNPEKEAAPRVMFKGVGHKRHEFLAPAQALNIPIIKSRALARELFERAEEGQIVPDQFYKVLVKLFIENTQLKDKLGGHDRFNSTIQKTG